MPRKSSEGEKKHGDKLESLVQRTAEGREAEDEENDDPTLLQDDDDESVRNDDDAEDRRDAPH